MVPLISKRTARYRDPQPITPSNTIRGQRSARLAFPPKRFPEYIIVLRDLWTEGEPFRELRSALPSRPCMSMHYVLDVDEVICLRSGTSRLLGVAHTIVKILSSSIETLETDSPAWKRPVFFSGHQCELHKKAV